MPTTTRPAGSPAISDFTDLTCLIAQFQFILDNYYRLAWDRKPEFMGYEMEWDSKENNRLHDTDFSFETGTAQKRLLDYENICEAYDMIERNIEPEQRPALFEMLGYAVHSAYQMNRKFLYAQRNHETGSAVYAEMSSEAHREIEQLRVRYNESARRQVELYDFNHSTWLYGEISSDARTRQQTHRRLSSA